MFLFNSFTGKDTINYRNVTDELTNALIEKKRQNPNIKIDFITDPVNNVYHGDTHKQTELLEQNGINVIYTALEEMRDSNIFYSPIWRLFIQWWGNTVDSGFLPHPFTPDDKVTFRSYFTLINFKANHRKVIFADSDSSWTALVTSANPHTGSAFHSNVAVKVEGEFAKEVFLSEKPVAEFSGDELQLKETYPQTTNYNDDKIQVRLVSESSIFKSMLFRVNQTVEGDSISIGVFYLSERNLMKSLVKAAKRGVDVRIILDPNKDAFGRKKGGIPNRPVATELINDSKGKIKIRWYDTHGEQFHSKFIIIEKPDQPTFVSLGSANFTRRNIRNFNLESNMILELPKESALNTELTNYFDDLWFNRNSNQFTADYSKYKSNNIFKYWLYRYMEATGMGTF
jgi:hypothetical protein